MDIIIYLMCGPYTYLLYVAIINITSNILYICTYVHVEETEYTRCVASSSPMQVMPWCAQDQLEQALMYNRN